VQIARTLIKGWICPRQGSADQLPRNSGFTVTNALIHEQAFAKLVGSLPDKQVSRLEFAINQRQRVHKPTFSSSSDKFQAHQFLMLIDGLGSDRLVPAFSVWKKQW
jgi:hypothetical protein